MNKKLIILGMALALAAVPSEAQFFKKLGKALDKVSKTVDKVASTTSNDDPMSRQLGKAIKLGDMTMTAYGDNLGIGFNFGSCYRQDGTVYLVFQYPNQGNRDVENIWIRNYEPGETAVYGPDGNKYNIAMIALGDRESSEGVSVNIPQGGYANGYLAITGVPANVNSLGKVIFNSTGQYPMDAVSHNYRFVLDNVAITEPPVAKTSGEEVDPSILDGSAIKAGLPLAETIRKAGKVIWSYGVDNGLYCSFGKVSLVIPDSAITKAGLAKLDALTSDINPDIDFSVNYLKPDAKITYFDIEE